MKKKIFYIISLGIIMFFLTGCVKFNANMEIKKDKSMNYSIIYAIDTSYFGGQDLLSSDDKQEIKEKGFNVTDYVDENMKGFTISKSIQNIDKVSSKENIEYSLSEPLEENSDAYIFKVKKGFLKNTYTANFSFDASNSNLNMDGEVDDKFDTQDTNLDWNWGTDDTESDYTTDIIDNSDMDFSQFSNNLSNIDLSFSVTLPYSAKSSNATSTNNDNKELKWILLANDNKNLEFEFEMYNIINIFLVVGGIFVLVVLIIVVVLINKKKGKTNNINGTEGAQNVENVLPAVEQSTPSLNNNDSLISSTVEPIHATLENSNNEMFPLNSSIPSSVDIEIQNPTANLNQMNSVIQQPIIDNSFVKNVNDNEIVNSNSNIQKQAIEPQNLNADMSQRSVIDQNNNQNSSFSQVENLVANNSIQNPVGEQTSTNKIIKPNISETSILNKDLEINNSQTSIMPQMNLDNAIENNLIQDNSLVSASNNESIPINNIELTAEQNIVKPPATDLSVNNDVPVQPQVQNNIEELQPFNLNEQAVNSQITDSTQISNQNLDDTVKETPNSQISNDSNSTDFNPFDNINM